MKVSDTTAPPTAFLMPTLVRKKHKSTVVTRSNFEDTSISRVSFPSSLIQKSHERNHRINSHPTSLPNASSIPINSYQVKGFSASRRWVQQGRQSWEVLLFKIVPVSSLWMSTTCQSSSPIISLINSNPSEMLHTPSTTGTEYMSME